MRPPETIDPIRDDVPYARWWLAAILLVAALVRIIDLATPSVWLDEAVTAYQSSLDFVGLLRANAYDVHPPLHNLLLFPFVHLFGAGEVVIRAPSVLFGLGTIFVTARITRMLFSVRAALVVAAMLALSPLHVFYADEARMYALLAFTGALSIWFFLRWLAAPSRGRALLYFFATAALLYTHAYAVFIVAAENVLMLWLFRRPSAERPPLRAWILLQGGLGLVFAPWAWVFVMRAKHIGDFWIPRPDVDLAREVITDYWSLAAPLVLVAIAFGLAARRRSRVRLVGQVERNILLLAIIAFSFVVPFTLSFFVQPFFWPRYTIAGSLAAFMLAAAGIARLRTRFLFPAAALVVALQIPQVFSSRSMAAHADWRATVAYLDAHAGPNDHVLAEPDFEILSLRYYLGTRLPSSVPPRVIDVGPPGKPPWLITPIDADVVWLVHSESVTPEPHAQLEAALARDYHRDEPIAFGPKLELTRYSRTPRVTPL